MITRILNSQKHKVCAAGHVKGNQIHSTLSAHTVDLNLRSLSKIQQLASKLFFLVQISQCPLHVANSHCFSLTLASAEFRKVSLHATKVVDSSPVSTGGKITVIETSFSDL